MRPIEFELLVDRAIDRPLQKQSVEDMRVELKREWIPEFDFARHLAGLCNAAIGAPVTIVVGVDEKAGELIGAAPLELADWWAKVKKNFDGEAPIPLHNRNLERSGISLVALQFGSDLAPYVIKNPNGGQFSLEVPWRENNSTRSAKRENLLRILAPWVRAPKVEILTASVMLTVGAEKNASGFVVAWEIHTDIFVHQPQDQQSVFAAHLASAIVSLSEDSHVQISGDSFHVPSNQGTHSATLPIVGPSTLRFIALRSERRNHVNSFPAQALGFGLHFAIPNCDKDATANCNVQVLDSYANGPNLHADGARFMEWHYSTTSPLIPLPKPTLQEYSDHANRRDELNRW